MDISDITRLVRAQSEDLEYLKQVCGGTDELAAELGIGALELENRIRHPDLVESLPSTIVFNRIAMKLGYGCSYMEFLTAKAGYQSVQDFLFA